MAELGKGGGILIEDLLRAEGVTKALQERLREADANQDGVLSVTELIGILENEKRAVADRKLFRNFLIALVVGMLVLIAALCGTVYAIVDLSKDVRDDNNVLVSKSSGQVMSTGIAIDAHEIEDLLSMGPKAMSSVQTLVFPNQNRTEYEIYHVSSMIYTPGVKVIIQTTGDDLFLGTANGVFRMDNKTGQYTEDFVTSLLESRTNSTSRKLFSADDTVGAALSFIEDLPECQPEYLEKTIPDCRLSFMDKVKTGAVIGSAIPGLGTAVGAAAGAVSWVTNEGIKGAVDWLFS